MQLHARMLVETIRRLRHRVSERFPESSLEQAISELERLGSETSSRVDRISRPMLIPRVLSGLLYLFLVGLFGVGVVQFGLYVENEGFGGENFFERLNNLLGTLVVLGGGVVVLERWEVERRQRAMILALQDLRNMLDVIDLHQLTKDPGTVIGMAGARAPSSPIREMTTYELSRYLSYCAEATSLTVKLATLYSQRSTDPIVLDSVEQVSAHAQGVSRGIQIKLQTLVFQTSGRTGP